VRNLDIAIIGAGIGGLTLAIALQRRGFRPVIYERAPALGEVGAGITLWPNANKVLFSLGLQTELDRISEEPENQSMWRFDTGEIFRVYPRGAATRKAYGAPLYQIHRRDLHDILVEAVKATDPGAIRLGRTVKAIETDDARATLIFADGERVRADLVAACDGARSTIRGQLFGVEPARFTGVVAWRALVPIEKVAPRLRAAPAGMHIGPDRNVSHYTVRHGALLNFLAFALVEAWTDEGWTIPAQPGELMAHFGNFQPDIVALLQATPLDTCFKWGLFDRDPVTRWSKGRAVLVGDAAHPMLPFLGQGAGIVIEDALILARAIAESETVATALRRYEAARVDRANLVLLRSRTHARYWNTHPDQIKDREPVMEVDLNTYDAASVAL
jgi:salicylate hydroxylase